MKTTYRARPRTRPAPLVLLEAYDPNQPRWPKGHPKAGQWRPKGGAIAGGTRSGRAASKRLERDLAEVREFVAQRGTSQVDLMAVGGRLFQIANRYSTAGAYRRRLDDVRAERQQIMDTAWDRIMAGKSTGDTDYTPREQKRLDAIGAEEVKLQGDINRADRDALVWALSGVRQMGGVKPKIGAVFGRTKPDLVEDPENGDYYLRGNPNHRWGAKGARELLAMDDQAEMRADLEAVMRYMPADWIRSLNAAGGLSLTASDERAHATKVQGIAGLITNRPKDRSTMLHEVMHVVEWKHGDELASGYTPLQMATHGLLVSRTQGEPLQKLKDLAPNSGYEDHEVTRPDRFFDPYMGKNYGGEYADSTEVLTMGVQFLFFPLRGKRGGSFHRDPSDTDRTTVESILGMLAKL